MDELNLAKYKVRNAISDLKVQLSRKKFFSSQEESVIRDTIGKAERLLTTQMIEELMLYEGLLIGFTRRAKNRERKMDWEDPKEREYMAQDLANGLRKTWQV